MRSGVVYYENNDMTDRIGTVYTENDTELS